MRCYIQGFVICLSYTGECAMIDRRELLNVVVYFMFILSQKTDLIGAAIY